MRSRKRSGISIISMCSIMLAVFLSIFSTATFATSSKQSSSPYFIEGFDVVSYFRDSGPLEGSTDLMVVKDDLTLLFSSEENLSDFQENPDAYMPAYNGNCAYGIVYGMKSMIDPLQYDIVDGRLYLQLNSGTKNRWNRRVTRNIKKGDRVWKKLSTPREQLR